MCEPRECVVVVHLVVVHVVPMQVALLLMLRTVCTRFELIYFLQTSAFYQKTPSHTTGRAECIIDSATYRVHAVYAVSSSFPGFFFSMENATFLRLRAFLHEREIFQH